MMPKDARTGKDYLGCIIIYYGFVLLLALAFAAQRRPFQNVITQNLTNRDLRPPTGGRGIIWRHFYSALSLCLSLSFFLAFCVLSVCSLCRAFGFPVFVCDRVMADWGATDRAVILEGSLLRRAEGMISFQRWKKHWARVTDKAVALFDSQQARGIDPKKYFVVNKELKVRHEPYRVSRVLNILLCQHF